MAVNKLERLMNLTAALLATERPLSREELHTRVPGYPEETSSFRRAFERDKNELRQMALPLSVEPVPGTDPAVEGYRIPPDEYYLRDPGLEADELAALHLAARAVRSSDGTSTGALRKLGGTLARDEPALESIGEVPVSPEVNTVFAAISERRLLSFVYRGERRTVEPRRLDLQRGRWYLTGHDRLRDGERNFRLDRIEGKVSIDDIGSSPVQPPGRPAWRHPWELGDGPPVPVRLLVDADHVGWVRRELGRSVVIEDRANGDAVFELLVVDGVAFRSFVMTLLDHGEVLSPPEIRDDIIAWVDMLAGR